MPGFPISSVPFFFFFKFYDVVNKEGNIVVQKHTREISKNGIIGQERKENQEKNGYQGGKSAWWPSFQDHMAGAGTRRCTEPLSWCLYKSPVWTEAAWLEDEIISSRISRVTQKGSESYSPLISFHFIIVCLS